MIADARHGSARKPISDVIAVLDACSLYGNANRRALVQAALDGTFDGILSAHVIGELYRILTIRWIRKKRRWGG